MNDSATFVINAQRDVTGWAAWFGDYDLYTLVGYGATEVEAVRDLIDKWAGKA